MLIISSDPNCQGFKIQSHGDVRRKEAVKSGLWLGRRGVGGIRKLSLLIAMADLDPGKWL